MFVRMKGRTCGQKISAIQRCIAQKDCDGRQRSCKGLLKKEMEKERVVNKESLGWL